MSEAAAAVKKPFEKVGEKFVEPFKQFGQATTGAAAGQLGGVANQINQNTAQASQLTGQATSNLGFDANSLKVNGETGLFDLGQQGQEQLISLINAFNSRQKEVQERVTEPGNSQTRLSMVR